MCSRLLDLDLSFVFEQHANGFIGLVYDGTLQLGPREMFKLRGRETGLAQALGAHHLEEEVRMFTQSFFASGRFFGLVGRLERNWNDGMKGSSLGCRGLAFSLANNYSGCVRTMPEAGT